MRRADRLFQIVQILRNRRRVTTARYLAHELEVTERTIYRDIQDLSLSGVPVRGEAGVGYALASDYDLPPLMFTDEELTAITLGARLVESWSDNDLAQAAKSAIRKIQAVVPERLQDRFEKENLLSPFRQIEHDVAANMASIRLATDSCNKLCISYHSLQDEVTKRTVRPLAMFFWGSVWTLGAWCELRENYRTFRVDRIEDLQVLQDKFSADKGPTLEGYLDHARSCGG